MQKFTLLGIQSCCIALKRRDFKHVFLFFSLATFYSAPDVGCDGQTNTVDVMQQKLTKSKMQFQNLIDSPLFLIILYCLNQKHNPTTLITCHSSLKNARHSPVHSVLFQNRIPLQIMRPSSQNTCVKPPRKVSPLITILSAKLNFIDTDISFQQDIS